MEGCQCLASRLPTSLTLHSRSWPSHWSTRPTQSLRGSSEPIGHQQRPDTIENPVACGTRFLKTGCALAAVRPHRVRSIVTPCSKFYVTHVENSRLPKPSRASGTC